MTLEGRVALVTGGGRGIGKAIALGLADDGADVAVNYRRDEASARDTVTEIEKLGRKARSYAASIDDFAMCEAMADDTDWKLERGSSVPFRLTVLPGALTVPSTGTVGCAAGVRPANRSSCWPERKRNWIQRKM